MEYTQWNYRFIDDNKRDFFYAGGYLGVKPYESVDLKATIKIDRQGAIYLKRPDIIPPVIDQPSLL